MKRWPVLKADRSPASMEAMSRNLEELYGKIGGSGMKKVMTALESRAEAIKYLDDLQDGFANGRILPSKALRRDAYIMRNFRKMHMAEIERVKAMIEFPYVVTKEDAAKEDEKTPGRFQEELAQLKTMGALLDGLEMIDKDGEFTEFIRAFKGITEELGKFFEAEARRHT